MREDHFYKSIIENAPIAYTYNRIIYDHMGNPKDYKILEANKAYKDMVGIQEKDLIGKRISQLYQDTKKSDISWEDYHNKIIGNYKTEDTEYYFDFNEKEYSFKIYSPKKDYIAIYHTYIRNNLNIYNGERLKCETCFGKNMIHNYINKDQSETRERILYSILESTKELLTNEDISSALSRGITILGDASQVDRVYYWENHYDEETKTWFTSQKNEWCSHGIEQQIDNPELQNVPFERVGDFIEILSQNKTFNSHVKDIEDGVCLTKASLQSQGILSVLTIPVFVKDEFKGFIGFDSCKYEREWSQIEISLLNSFVLLYSKAWEKKILEDSIIQSKENLFNFFNMIEDLLFVLDFEGNMVDINKNVLKKFNYSREELLGKPFSMLHPKDKVEEVNKNIEDLIMKKSEYCNIPYITKYGHVFPVETRVSKGVWNGEKVIFAVSKDITRLVMSEEKFSKAFNNSGLAMFISKYKNGEILEVNDGFVDYLGYERNEVVGMSILDFKILKNIGSGETMKKEIETQGKISDMEIETTSKDNSTRIGLVNITPLDINNEKCLITSIVDINDRVKYEQKIIELSNVDFLTGIYNRRCFYNRAEEILEEYKRDKNAFTLAIIDIDDFKQVNDRYGHQVGDFVLKKFSQIIKENIRSYDIVGRYGGEEFIIIFKYADKKESCEVLDRILNIVRNESLLPVDEDYRITFSAGISCCKEFKKDEVTIDKLVALADKRMYKVKEYGKNEIFYN